MSSDAYVTERLLDAEVGRSHAELAGEIKVLAEAQRGLASTHALASRLSSEEHARVQSSLDGLSTKLDTLTETVADVVAGQQADEAVAKWRRRAIGALATIATLVVGTAGVVVAGLAGLT